MRHERTAFLLACVGILFAAVASAPAGIEPPAQAPQAGVILSEPDACFPLPPAAGEFAPVAICRLIPECWSNDDCDVRCGTNGGRCVHSKCPVRICKCN